MCICVWCCLGRNAISRLLPRGTFSRALYCYIIQDYEREEEVRTSTSSSSFSFLIADGELVVLSALPCYTVISGAQALERKKRKGRLRSQVTAGSDIGPRVYFISFCFSSYSFKRKDKKNRLDRS